MEIGGIEPLPGYVDPNILLARAAEVLLPPSRIRPSEAAEKYRRVVTPSYEGPWENARAPYMVEPMDMTASRDVEAVVFCGPAQSLKTDALLVNTIVHRTVCDPLDTMIVQMDQQNARHFSISRLRRLLDHEAPKVAERLRPGRSSDTITDKQFRGMMLTVAWPTVSHLSSKAVGVVALTDRDRMPDDLEGEGEPFDLARQRTKTFGSRGMTICESSPGRDFTDPTWKPETPHQAPPVAGILGLYNQGDRRRWYWTCPQCGTGFEPRFDLLSGSPAEPIMVCPHCGMPIEESDKARLNAGGRWLAEGLSIVDGAIVGEAITSPIASYWLRGPAAVFQTWRGLLERYQSALRTYEENGEETRLRTTVNTDQAEPYIPQAILAKRSEGVLDQETLKARAEPGPINVVPAGTLFVVAAVDVQGTHFVVQLEAFARDLESTIFARFDVTRPNLSAGDADRLLDPARFLEDWDQLLDPVIRTAWPIADRPGHVMRAALVMYDTHGAAGVTDNAYRFWRRYREDDGERICPIRGAGGFKVPRFVMTHPNSGRKDRHAGARGEVPVLQVGVDHMKDMVDRGLRRTERGPGKTHLLARLPDRVFAELCAESREETGWVRVRKRNEAFDLSAYAKAGALHLTNGVDWSRPDRWPSFMRSEGNPHIITLPGAHPPIVPPGAVAAEPAPGSAALPTVSPEEGGGVVLPAEDKSVRQNRLLSALLGKTR